MRKEKKREKRKRRNVCCRPFFTGFGEVGEDGQPGSVKRKRCRCLWNEGMHGGDETKVGWCVLGLVRRCFMSNAVCFTVKSSCVTDGRSLVLMAHEMKVQRML